MPLEILTGDEVPALLERAQGALGADAVVLSVRRVQQDGRRRFELVAADPRTAARMTPPRRPGVEPPAQPVAMRTPGPEALTFAERVGWTPPVAAVPPTPHGRRPTAAARGLRFPWTPARTARRAATVIALVGPTGAGKTTTLAKLAHHAAAFGGRRCAFLGLDAFRVGGFEQLREYAEIGRTPCELARDARDLERARRRLADAEVLLVDTAGRGPAQSADVSATRAQLLALAPDEVHLVLPAGLSRPAARAVIARHLPYGVTHLLPTKLDEHPDDTLPFELADAYGLPLRWLADGQNVPQDLQRAGTGALRTESV